MSAGGPAFGTRFTDGYSQYTNGWTDSFQSATPTVATGVSAFASGTAMKIALPANNANGTPTGSPGGTASAPSGNYQRCEVYPAVAGLGCVAADGDIYPGSTGYFGLSILLDTAFPTTTTTWQVISQWKNDGTGTPPFELKVGNGFLYLDGNSHAWSYNICPVIPGGQYNIVIGATFTESVATSYISAWVNGTQYLNNVQPSGGEGLLYPGVADYWKVGIYRDSAIQPAATVYYGAIAHDAAYQPVADYIAATVPAPSTPTSPPTTGGSTTAPGHDDATPYDLFATVQQMLNGIDPDQGQQAMLIEAMHLCHDELATQQITAPANVGVRIRGDRAAVDAAAAAAAAVGEPGSYVATHDGKVYSPVQMAVQLHRMLIALGWTTTSPVASAATPDPVPNPSGQANVLVFPDISNYQAGISLTALKSAGYAGLIAKIGQGASSSQGYGQTVDASWPGWWSQAKSLWGQRFMGYWYVGDSETPASQAARCKAAIGDITIPVELDWEVGGGSWTNLLNVLAAFRAAGLNVTSIYTYNSYGTANGATNIDATGCALRLAHYPNINQPTPAQGVAAVPASFWNSYQGGTIDVLQFASDCAVLTGYHIDCNVFRGTMDQLAGVFQGAPVVVQPTTTVPVGSAPALFTPATWRAALDQGGLAGTHTALGINSRFPTSLPDGQVIDVAKAKLPGGRQGFAFAASLPPGATRVIAQPNIATPVEGQESWFGFSVLLSRNFPVTDGRFHALCYWRNPDTTVPLMLMTSNNRLCVAGYTGTLAWLFNQDFADIDVMTWHDIIMRVKFSKTPGVGTLDVYLDGAPALVDYAPPSGTLTASGNTVAAANLRYGFYRDSTSPNEACAYHMNWAMGPSFGSVMLPGSG